VLENIGEADQHRERDAAQDQRIDQLLQIDGAGGIFGWMDMDVAISFDGEIALAPTGDIVQIAGMLSGPPLRIQDQRPFSTVSLQLTPESLSVLKNERSGKKNL